MSILGDLGNSILGNVPKAALYIRKPGSIISDTESMIPLGTTLNIMRNDDYMKLEVQYNPASIHMETVAGVQQSFSGGNMGTQANNQVVQVKQPVSTTMNFQLIFDDVNVYDAFMMQNLNLSVGNAVSAVADLTKKIKAGDKMAAYSVQAQIDGLVSLLVRMETRVVMFCWADMSFQGELTGVEAKYTMFNKDGEPIRGVVGLTIRQGDKDTTTNSAENGFSEDVTTYWNNAFDNLFGGAKLNLKSGGSSTLSKITQNNLLNLNI